jgi:hypothetical protein
VWLFASPTLSIHQPAFHLQAATTSRRTKGSLMLLRQDWTTSPPKHGKAALALCVSLLAGCGLGAPSPGEGPTEEIRSAVVAPTTVTVALPAGGSLQTTILSATGTLLVDSRAIVGGGASPVEVASFGTQTTQIAASARVNGDVSSAAPVSLGSSAVVTGFVRSGGAITSQAGATVGGASTPSTPIGQTPFSWTATIPSTNGGALTVFAGQSSAPAPAAYGAVTAYGNATLSLRTGTYFFTSFDAEPGANIKLDETIGPVVIYVTGAVTLRGNLVAVGGTGTNLLFVSLGTGLVDVTTPLLGTLVAPSGTVSLERPNNNQPHVGQVFAQKIELFSNATLNFGAFDWRFFCPLGDSDGDGVTDCQDACPADPKKSTPGVCGCGVADTDSDGDGLADCIDRCPNDPAKSEPGQCGCAGSAKPAGTPCSDGICIGINARELACDGAGQCGDANACSPDPGHCVAKVFRDSVYWICSGATSWAQASANCASVPGRSLARIDSRAEDAVVGHFISTPAWIGGNDQAAAGTWRWALGANASGDTFFSGGAPATGMYTNWAAATPGDNAGACAAMVANGTGQWIDQSCAKALPYICERSSSGYGGPDLPPIACTEFSPNLACPPTFDNCVASDPVLAEPADQFKAEIEACLAANCTQDGDPGCAQCTGAASIPPVGSTCTPTGGTPCGITNPHGTCATNLDCAPGEICEIAPSTCVLCSENSADPNCKFDCPPGVLQCGTPQPGCSAPTTGTERCQEVNLCAPQGASGDSNPFNDATTDLATFTFDPANEFTPPPAKATVYPPDTACASPPCALGSQHPWCKFVVDNPLKDQNPGHAKHGNSGKGGLIEFNFDPNLTLSFTNEKPFALGETKFKLIADAEFAAGVTFNLGSLGSNKFSIIDAEAALKANRCRAWTTDSKLEIFGHNFLPDLLPEMLYDTDPKVLDAGDCTKAFATFETLFNRAKKAMKDAQELLTQYNALKAGGKSMTNTLCQQIASDPPAGFPVGNCATESPEATINRFIDFYGSELKKATDGQLALAAKQLVIKESFPIGDQDHEEDQTLFSSTFLVGPIPVTLDVDAVEHYGIGGGLTFRANPGAILVGGTREELAHVKGEVHPFANAGASLALSVGFNFDDILAVEAGVEGMVTLGNITVPVSAGAGIDVQPAPDNRPPPPELAAISGAIPFIKPMEYQFLMTFDYGAEVDINKILAGSLNVRVHVAFLFFSKTWRATIVSFKGFSLPPLVLFKGKSGDIALGDAPWATVQMPNPFPTLTKLPVPASPPPPSATQVPADTSKVEKFFYDSQCQCIDPGQACHRNADCCAAGPLCFSDPAGPAGAPATCTTCRSSSQSCNTDSDCCAGNAAGCYPTADTAGAPKACTQCLNQGRVCDPNHNLCCNGCLPDNPANPNTAFHCGSKLI